MQCGLAWSTSVWLSTSCVPRRPEEAVEHALPALAVEANVDVVAADRRPERTSGRAKRRSRPRRADRWRCGRPLVALALELVVVDEGVVLDDDLGHRVGEVDGARRPGEGLDHRRLSLPRPATTSTREYDAVGVAVGVADVDDHAGALDDGPGGHEDDDGVGSERGVEVGEDALAPSASPPRCGSSRWASEPGAPPGCGLRRPPAAPALESSASSGRPRGRVVAPVDARRLQRPRSPQTALARASGSQRVRVIGRSGCVARLRPGGVGRPLLHEPPDGLRRARREPLRLGRRALGSATKARRRYGSFSSATDVHRARGGRGLLLEPGVALLLELERQSPCRRSARSGRPTSTWTIVGHDVVEQALVVGDHDERALRRRAAC